jgi:hypothetical protein
LPVYSQLQRLGGLAVEGIERTHSVILWEEFMRTYYIARACAALSLTFATSTFAGAALSSAHVLAVRVDANGSGVIFFDQPFVGTPSSCAAPGYQSALAFNATTGKAALALALSAKATGSPVEVYGTGACGVYGVIEDYSYGVLH